MHAFSSRLKTNMESSFTTEPTRKGRAVGTWVAGAGLGVGKAAWAGRGCSQAGRIRLERQLDQLG